jgi:hypothetical protein
MKRRLWILAVVVALAATAVTLLIGVAGAADEGTSRVRLVHAIPGSIVVHKAYVDGELIYENVAYKDVTPYTVLTAGVHSIQAVVEPFPPISETLILTGGIDATLAGVGVDLTGVEPVALEDDNRDPNLGTVRVVHLSPGTEAMSVTLTSATTTTVISDLPYKGASDYVGGLGPGVVSVSVRSGGAIMDLQPPTATLKSNAIHTLFIMGPGDDLALVTSVDRQQLYSVLLPLIVKGGAGG